VISQILVNSYTIITFIYSSGITAKIHLEGIDKDVEDIITLLGNVSAYSLSIITLRGSQITQ